jgi:Uma2 family endonuclease
MLTLKQKRPVLETLPENGEMRLKGRMTEQQFVAWAEQQEDLRAEWVDGEVIITSPASVEHEQLLIWLFNVLHPFVEQQNLGVILGSNVTVRLASQKRRRIPDLLFVSNARQDLVKENHVEGPPDLIIEVVSPDSQTRDRRKKHREYEKGGVREYWILDPLSQRMEAYALKRGAYVELEPKGGAIHSLLLAGFYLRTAWLWRRPLPKVLTIQKELVIR